MEDDLPRRRSAYSMHFAGEALQQGADVEHSEQHSLVGEGVHRRGSGPVEDDLPRRRYSMGVAGQRLVAEVDDRSERHSTGGKSEQRRKAGGPVEDDLPRRRSAYSMHFAGEALQQGADDEHPEQHSLVGEGVHRRGSGPGEDDVPRRRSGCSMQSAGKGLPSGAGDEQSERVAAVYRHSRGHRWGRGPVEDDVPRRRSSYYASSAPNTGYHSASEESNIEGAKSHCERSSRRAGGLWGWMAAGPVEDSLPRRNSSYSVDASTQSTNDETSQPMGGRSDGNERSWGLLTRASSVFGALSWGPAESTESRRRPSVYSVDLLGTGDPGTYGAQEDLQGTGITQGSNGQQSWFDEPDEDASRRGSTLFGLPWGRMGRAPVAVDLPRRSSGYSCQRQTATEAGTTDRSHRGEGRRTEVDLSNWDYLLDVAPVLKPAFAGRMDVAHKPVEVDIPRRRSCQFSLPEGGVGGVTEARSGAETRNNDDCRTVGADAKPAVA